MKYIINMLINDIIVALVAICATIACVGGEQVKAPYISSTQTQTKAEATPTPAPTPTQEPTQKQKIEKLTTENTLSFYKMKCVNKTPSRYYYIEAWKDENNKIVTVDWSEYKNDVVSSTMNKNICYYVFFDSNGTLEVEDDTPIKAILPQD